MFHTQATLESLVKNLIFSTLYLGGSKDSFSCHDILAFLFGLYPDVGTRGWRIRIRPNLIPIRDRICRFGAWATHCDKYSRCQVSFDSFMVVKYSTQLSCVVSLENILKDVTNMPQVKQHRMFIKCIFDIRCVKRQGNIFTVICTICLIYTTTFWI
jgi:hypothetical protein